MSTYPEPLLCLFPITIKKVDMSESAKSFGVIPVTIISTIVVLGIPLYFLQPALENFLTGEVWKMIIVVVACAVVGFTAMFGSAGIYHRLVYRNKRR